MTWLPKRRLSSETAISSREELETAVAELAAIKTREANLDTEFEKQVQYTKEQCAKFKRLKVGRTEVAFVDRVKQLEDAVVSYCNEHKETLLSNASGKTLNLTHGAISWRAARRSVGFADGLDEKTVVAKFEQRNVSKLLLKTLEGITWFGSKLGCFLKIKISLDKTKILKLASEQAIPAKALKQAGLVINRGDETMSIKLSDYQVKG